MNVKAVIRTNVTPEISVDLRDTGERVGFLGRLLQPTVDASVPVLGNVHLAPYGDAWFWGEVVLYGVAVLAAIGAVALIRWIFD